MAERPILLIEDNLLDARLIRELLRHPIAGLGELICARTMEAGLSEMIARRPAIVLMDLFLPDSEGLIGLSRIQARAFATPVIVLTGLQDESLAMDALKAGAQDYLIKGRFDAELLTRSIQYALERHRLMDTLRVYEERYALAVQATSVGIWDWNPVNDKVFFSNRWKDLLGYTGEEVSFDANWARQLVHPDDFGGLMAQVEAHLAGSPKQVDAEVRMKHRLGQYRWMKILGLVARDSAGEAYRMVGSMVDITDQRRMEEALSEEKEQLEVTLRSIGDGVIATDPQGVVRLINPVAEALTGFRDGEALGRPIAEVFPVLDEELSGIWAAEGRQENAKKTGRVRTLVARDGTERLIEVMQSTMYGKNRTTHGSVYVVRDVTDRQKAEMARANLAAIVESTDGAIFSKTLDGLVTSWNAGAERMLGYPASEVIGRGTDFLEGLSPLTGRLELTQKLVRGESTEYSETKLRQKNGDLLDVALTKSLIRNHDGEVIGISTIAHDIGERKRAERQLAVYREQLEQLIQERTRELTATNHELESFSYSVSHDLRAPLRSIDGFTQALREDYSDKLDDQGRQYIERVHQATQRMSQLIDDLLNLSRVTRAAVTILPVDLSGVAAGVVKEFREGEAGRSVEVSLEPGMLAFGDERLLRVLLTNLLGNAWKFTRKQPAARIDFGRIASEGELQTFRVQDNGAGFDMQYARKLFTPFQRLHGMSEFEGTGIGLAIAQRVVHRHGGTIWAESAVGTGAKIFFTLRKAPERGEGHASKTDPVGGGQS